MSARQDLDEFLGEWRRLTQAEAAAIQSASWSGVAAIQSAKSALQQSLSDALKRLVAETGSPLPANHPLRAEAGRLISLENRNADLLAEQIRHAEARMKSQSGVLLNLRRLHLTYGRGHDQGRLPRS
jgi:hypothetical protein